MTYIGERVHPRKRGWVWMMCDECFQNYWAAEKPKGAKHKCAGCAEDVNSVHFTSGTHTEADDCDMDYHGGLFMRGEW